MGGVFIVVGFVLCLSFLILSFEFIWKAMKLSNDKYDFILRVKYALKTITRNFFKQTFKDVFVNTNDLEMDDSNQIVSKERKNVFLGKKSFLLFNDNHIIRHKLEF